MIAASVGIMAVGGEYLCMKRELEPIDVGRNLNVRKRHASTAPGDAVELSLLESGEGNS